MWCDIHLCIEEYKEKKWKRKPLKHLIRNDDESDYKRCLFIKTDELPKWIEELTHRNYLNFMILWWVRRQWNTKSIQEDRWLPHDVSKKFKEYSDQRWDDWHSHWYLTIQEIIDFFRDDSWLDQYHFQFMQTIRDYLDSIKKPKKTRLVFFFDN